MGHPGAHWLWFRKNQFEGPYEDHFLAIKGPYFGHCYEKGLWDHRYHIYRCLTVANTSVPYWFYQIFINIPPSVQIHSWRQQNILHYALEKWELLTGLGCHDTIYSLFSAWILCKSFTFSVLITRLKTYVVPYLRLWMMTIWNIKYSLLTFSYNLIKYSTICIIIFIIFLAITI